MFLILCVCVLRACAVNKGAAERWLSPHDPQNPSILWTQLSSSEQQQDDIADKDRQDMVVKTPFAPTLTKKQILNTKQLSTPNDTKACLRAHQGKGPTFISTRCTCVECGTDMYDVQNSVFERATHHDGSYTTNGYTERYHCFTQPLFFLIFMREYPKGKLTINGGHRIFANVIGNLLVI